MLIPLGSCIVYVTTFPVHPELVEGPVLSHVEGLTTNGM